MLHMSTPIQHHHYHYHYHYYYYYYNYREGGVKIAAFKIVSRTVGAQPDPWLQMVHSQSTFLLKMTILSHPEAPAPNGPFSINFLIKNNHSEPPRGAGSKWSVLNALSY